MRVRLNTLEFERQIDNLVEYSLGFLEGAESGKKIFLDNLGKGTVEALKLYIDAMARSNPQSLHHVYEWSKTGSRDGRLFDVQYRITNLGLSLDSNFRQSTSVQSGSYQPFYNKARVKGSYEKTFDTFITRYFAQSFLTVTGLYDYLSNPQIYKKNFRAGVKAGKSVGQSTGFRWITNAKVEVE